MLARYRRSLLLAFLFTVIADVLAIAPVIYMLNVFDRVLTSRSTATLVSLMLVIVGLFVFWTALEWIRARLLVRLSLRVDWDLAVRAFDASFRRQVRTRNANVHRVLANVLTLRQFMTGQPLIALMSAPSALVYVAVGALFHVYLAIFALLAALLMLAATLGAQRAKAPLLRRANDASAEASRIAAFNMRHAEAAQALGMQGALRRRWHDRHRSFLALHVGGSEAAGLWGGTSAFLSRALPSLQLSLGAWLAIEGHITGGMVIAASVLISRAISPIHRLLTGWKEVAGARQAYEQLKSLLAEEPEEEPRMKLPPPQGRLALSVSTALPPGGQTPVLSALRFAVEPGSIVAVVGPSGSGKTCLTRLLVGVWRPTRGSVRLDGVEIAEWNPEELGPHLGYVPQEIEFFEGTVAENIARLGPLDADKAVEAARLIDAHNMVLALPKGYDTRLGESGHALSAGQRQRIAMARAFYGMPRYVVMDEPNSNLDEPGEQALSRALTELKRRGSTVILTTHRPRLVGIVDFILVLRGGEQLRFGPAEAMLGEVRRMKTAAGQRSGEAQA